MYKYACSNAQPRIKGKKYSAIFSAPNSYGNDYWLSSHGATRKRSRRKPKTPFSRCKCVTTKLLSLSRQWVHDGLHPIALRMPTFFPFLFFFSFFLSFFSCAIQNQADGSAKLGSTDFPFRDCTVSPHRPFKNHGFSPKRKK